MENKIIFISLIFVALLIGSALLYTPKKDMEKNTTIQNNDIKNSVLATVSAPIFASENTSDNRILIDVRTKEEYEAGHIKNAKNIDSSSPTFLQDINALDKTKQYSVYCRSGNKSNQALKLMESLGFEDVIDLRGGITEWLNIGETLCTTDTC